MAAETPIGTMEFDGREVDLYEVIEHGDEVDFRTSDGIKRFAKVKLISGRLTGPGVTGGPMILDVPAEEDLS